MAEAYKKLAQGDAPDTVGVIYTVPGATEAIIKNIRVVNHSGGAATIKLWHDGVADANVILPAVSLAAGEWGEFDGTILMETGDTLHAESDTASAIVVTVYGVEVT